MKRILVATDFSTRSDRALRRATLLARQYSTDIAIVHVIDDDQPPRLLKAEEREARKLLDDLAATVREVDRLSCDTRLEFGGTFSGHRGDGRGRSRRGHCDGAAQAASFAGRLHGTTIERTIRHSRQPIIMTNAVPARRYDRILVATDLSDCSETAVTKAREVGIHHVETIIVHAFEAPAQSMMIRSSMTMGRRVPAKG